LLIVIRDPVFGWRSLFQLSPFLSGRDYDPYRQDGHHANHDALHQVKQISALGITHTIVRDPVQSQTRVA
jgi:hypothetical protein